MLISHASKVMLKILQKGLQQYVKFELPDFQAGLEKAEEADQIANMCWIIKKTRKFQKNINFYFSDYAKAFDCVDHNKLCKILKEMGIQDHLTCLLRNLYEDQEASKVVWYSYFFKNFAQFVVIQIVNVFGIVNKAEIDVFLEFPCFFYDPTDVGNLISGSSAFYKSNLYVWQFWVHILLKPRLENFEHYPTSV